MNRVWIVAAVWLALAIVLARLIGAAIALADRKARGADRDALHLVVAPPAITRGPADTASGRQIPGGSAPPSRRQSRRIPTVARLRTARRRLHLCRSPGPRGTGLPSTVGAADPGRHLHRPHPPE